MLNKSLSIFLFTFICFQCYSQNLVPNPSFEEYNVCPEYQNNISEAIGWFYPFKYDHAEYFNKCCKINADSNGHGVPLNVMGFQKAKSGNGYAGFVLFGNYNYREYLEIKLKNPLLKKNKYYAEFFISLANNSVLAVDAIGIFFSEKKIKYDTVGGLINKNPQVFNINNNIITDTMNWVKISGKFIAEGGEEYILLGGFLNDENVHKKNNFGNWGEIIAYYYIDDVLVKKIGFTNFSKDTSICKGESIKLFAFGEKIIGWVENNDPNKIISQDSILEIKPYKNTSYTVFSEDDTLTIEIKIKDNTQSDIKVIKELTCENNKLILLASGGVKYLWNTKDTTSEITQIIAQKGKTLNYIVTVTGDNGCSVTNEIAIDYCYDFEIPNVLTPNGDGHNDRFEVLNLPLNSKLEIFNRWGNMIFKSENYDNKWGGGNYSAGVYFYLLTLPGGEIRKGFVEIIK